MSRVAFVFPGQGSQYLGMGEGLNHVSPAAAEVFRAADDALGEQLTRLCFEGPQEKLDQTVNAQPAILATSIAYLRAWQEQAGPDVPTPAYYAGHSMGQYSALVAAGVISMADGLRLVRERGRQMQASASDGAMAAVIGLPDERLPELIAAGESAGVFTIANWNSPGQIVISGERAAVERASAAAKELGAKRALLLPVSVAAHSPLMATAAENMRTILADVRFDDPAAPLLSNASAQHIWSGELCRNELVEHLTLGVDWIGAVRKMREEGVTQFIEVGPGKVLTGLIRRIAPDAEAHALDDPSAAGRLSLPTFATGAAT